jgi:hypothetical protein
MLADPKPDLCHEVRRKPRSLAWLLANRRLTVRYERRADLLQAFLHLACAPVCARKLQPL